MVEHRSLIAPTLIPLRCQTLDNSTARCTHTPGIAIGQEMGLPRIVVRMILPPIIALLRRESTLYTSIRSEGATGQTPYLVHCMIETENHRNWQDYPTAEG